MSHILPRSDRTAFLSPCSTVPKGLGPQEGPIQEHPLQLSALLITSTMSLLFLALLPAECYFALLPTPHRFYETL